MTYSGNTWTEGAQISDNSEHYPIGSQIAFLDNEVHFFWSYFDNENYDNYYIASRKLCI
jgi:hypothetical protein